jgi:antitoxin ParD1/3/4
MPTRRIRLTAIQDRFIEKAVKAGEYRNASEVVNDALSALQQHRREDARKLRALRLQIKAGVEALHRGDFIEVAGIDIDRYLKGPLPPSPASLREAASPYGER